MIFCWSEYEALRMARQRRPCYRLPAMPARLCEIDDLPALLAPNARLIGLDLGENTIGLALSDVNRTIASPLETLPRGKFKADSEKLLGLAKKFDAGGLVIGLPKNMDGTEGPRAEKSRMVAQRLTDATGLEVVLWDERRSSIEAHGILHANGRKEKKHRQTVDAVAASLILEGYLGTLR